MGLKAEPVEATRIEHNSETEILARGNYKSHRCLAGTPCQAEERDTNTHLL